MKIEKISENQIKFLLTNEDLKEREIKISELEKGTEKAQAFFRDIMTEAMLDCGFDASNTPLVIEAMPIAMDSVMIIVSKITKDENLYKAISLAPKSLDERKFKQETIKIIENNLYSNIENNEDEESVYIYSFKSLDEIIDLSSRIEDQYSGDNIIYKYDDKYFLTIQKTLSFAEDLDPILSEYGQKHISTIISKYHLAEHGEVIVKSNALSILASI